MSVVDSGYAWLTLTAAFTCEVVCGGIIYSAGYFYMVFADQLDGPSYLLPLVLSLNMGLYNAITSVAGILIPKYGVRMVGTVGGVLISVGLVLSVFATTALHLLFTFGIITGIGVGTSHTAAILSTTIYFEKYRQFAMAAVTLGMSAGSLLVPLLLDALTKQYGWRGMMLLIGGLSLHSILCAATFIPVHHKNTIHSFRTDVKNETISKTGSLLKQLNLHLLKNVRYCCHLIHIGIANIVLSIVYIHLGTLALSLGHSQSLATLLFVLIGIGSLCFRTIFSILAQKYTAKVSGIYMVAFIIGGIAMCACPYSINAVMLQIIVFVMGIVVAAYGSLTGSILSQMFPISEFAGAYGQVGPIAAAGSVGGGPFAKWLKDVSGSYRAVFITAGVLNILSLILVQPPALRQVKVRTVNVQDAPQSKSQSSLHETEELAPI